MACNTLTLGDDDDEGAVMPELPERCRPKGDKVVDDTMGRQLHAAACGMGGGAAWRTGCCSHQEKGRDREEARLEDRRDVIIAECSR